MISRSYMIPKGTTQVHRCAFTPIYGNRKMTWLRVPSTFIAGFEDLATARAVCRDLNRSSR